MKKIEIVAPLDEKILTRLKAGDEVKISGIIYTARDAAHQRLYKSLKSNQKLPFDLQGQIIYYTGPTPARKGQIIGSCGPTTSSRMDYYTPLLLNKGLKATVGKGRRLDEVVAAMKKFKAVYLATLGGCGALLSQCVRSAEVVAYPDLGTEAIFKLEVEDFPAIVINDIYGRDWYRK